ncbi:hypothetical protein BASA60_001246 [Batrachochytrium salamandrivorans]|nr:hypothetical protein BASA60_001246 [Batrachochytrium salamandrivorans]
MSEVKNNGPKKMSVERESPAISNPDLEVLSFTAVCALKSLRNRQKTHSHEWHAAIPAHPRHLPSRIGKVFVTSGIVDIEAAKDRIEQL